MRTCEVIIGIILSAVVAVSSLSTVSCDFEKIASTYVCNPTAVSPVTKENEEIQVNGTHLVNLKDEDVTYVRFNSPLVVQYVPTKLFEIFESIEIFGMQNVNLVNLTTDAFTNCYRLKSLHIDGNKKLIKIPARFAENCGSLENLYFPGNAIKVIDKEAFKGLDNVQYIVLTRNDIEDMDEETFSHVANLQQLFLDYNKIMFLKNDLLFPLRKLEFLSITYNQIQEISLVTFRNKPLLDQIFFDHNEIVAIDEKFFDEFPGRREDYEYRFYNNNCTNSIISNKLDRIANFDDFERCFKNWNESHLVVKADEESSTENDIAALTESADLAERDLLVRECRYFLNEHRKYTCVLENVDFVVTKITGQHFGDLSDEHVTQLFFYNSTLSRVPPIIFQKFPNLEFLSVSNTQLTIINDQTFGDCGKLTNIDASGNEITKIVETALKKCKKLKTIDVSGNPLEYIDGEIFYYDPQLKHIIMHRKF